MCASAFIGFIMIEFAFYKTRRYRDGNEARDAMFPGYRRLDIKNWARWKFYPGALFLMPTRALFVCLLACVLAFLVKIVCIGHDFKKGPVPPGCRKTIIAGLFWVFVRIYLLICGLSVNCKNIDYDYSEYLGPNYKDE